MKKIPLIVLLLFLFMPLSARTLAYGLGYYAQTVTEDEQRTNSGLEVSFVYEPFLFTVCNPALVVSAAYGKNINGNRGVPYIQAALSIDIFRTLHHPFSLIAHNPIAWDPSVSVGYQWVPEAEQQLLYLSASPLKMSQKDFWYEFFSPFVSLDVSTKKIENWGFNLIRYTYFFR
ncbi:hypothetical protein SpiGrapes_2736 [Sphaerochaeta pleomorpha str. Grapes]|uniref:Uncharacterized protein n=1 Tax=Sphaerochaeta pleomorpha (strain ATCC BAA-1885 / DSM 22778 / Grapes) TaxID=158190 RepID=G8QVW9_SPHPG|nr:hypothetical protein [Sphaerochaeta pleomorpha]AEV30493.1 hypothetical protein SpiGrapes_2736 [Sphaerochaeta pleomorpha str. Grapes]